MPKSPENDYKSPPQEPDGQLPFDQPIQVDSPEAEPGQAVQPFKKYESKLPIEISQTIGANQAETARTEISRRDDGAYSSPRLVREAIGGLATTTEDADRQEARSTLKNSQKQPRNPRAKRPYRARYKDTTDHVVRQLKPEADNGPVDSPDADIDEIFGAEEARRIL